MNTILKGCYQAEIRMPAKMIESSGCDNAVTFPYAYHDVIMQGVQEISYFETKIVNLLILFF